MGGAEEEEEEDDEDERKETGCLNSREVTCEHSAEEGDL